jgi:hypothetical protein
MNSYMLRRRLSHMGGARGFQLPRSILVVGPRAYYIGYEMLEYQLHLSDPDPTYPTNSYGFLQILPTSYYSNCSVYMYWT